VRKHGLTCDNVLAFEVVTADGERLVATADDHRDLFWALRGGGGNFGVVTSFLYRAHPVGTVLGGLLVHPRDRARELIARFRDTIAGAPEALGGAAAMITTPDGMPAAAVVLCWSGELDEGERVLKPLRDFGPPLVDAIAPMPFPAMQRVLDGAFPDGTLNYWRSSFVRELSDPVIDAIVEHGDRMASPLSGTLIEYYGGAPGRVDPADSAFAQRRAEFNIAFTAQWTDPGETAQHTAWARAATTALEPFGSTGGLLNFSSHEAADAAALAFGPNLKRLSEIKRRYDPTNFFSLNVNVPVAG
jgi:FAD/FMN-containing dehydrogenase